MSEPNWVKIYQRMCQADPDPWNKEPWILQIFRDAMSPKSLHQVGSKNSQLPDPELWKEIALLNEDEKIDRGRDPSDPLDNAYHAAVLMRILSYSLGSVWGSSSSRGKYIYRGQRKEWRVIPTLFRDNPTSTQIEERLKHVGEFVRDLQMQLPDLQFSDEQGVAVAQHYSKEAGLATWLIDVTRDPFVALNFASNKGEDGDLGVVYAIWQREWERLSAHGESRLGGIRIIDVPTVQRIVAQHALFIDTSHPALFEQYVPYTLWFRQKNGVVFEDRNRKPPITADTLSPRKDPILDFIHTRIPASLSYVPISYAPSSYANEELNPWDYLLTVLSWCRKRGWILNDHAYRLVIAICDFHYRLQDHHDLIGLPSRSLHRLENAVEWIWKQPLGKREDSLQDIVQFNYINSTGDEREKEIFEKLLSEIEQIHW